MLFIAFSDAINENKQAAFQTYENLLSEWWQSKRFFYSNGQTPKPRYDQKGSKTCWYCFLKMPVFTPSRDQLKKTSPVETGKGTTT
jgi:hypothetical protein